MHIRCDAIYTAIYIIKIQIIIITCEIIAPTDFHIIQNSRVRLEKRLQYEFCNKQQRKVFDRSQDVVDICLEMFTHCCDA